MFDTQFRDVSDAALVAAIEHWTVAEAAAAAHRLSAIAELAERRTRDEDHTATWCCDAWDAAAAEVSAAVNISHGRALGQIDLGTALRRRLPRVAALFLAGGISLRVIEAIDWRTALVEDPGAMAAVDSALAGLAGNWNALSRHKLDQAIDALVDRHDPAALRRTRSAARSREVTIGAQHPHSGTAALWGRLFATDAALLERRLEQMARAVCEEDPRTIGQRRADALGALAAGAEHLTCQCDDPECPTTGPDPRATSVVIHVLADAEALDAQPDPAMSGDTLDPDTLDPDTADPDTSCGHRPGGHPAKPPGAAVIVGGGALPTPLLAALIASGATTRHLRTPQGPAEPRYRPSTALDEFIRMRDLTCRFPGCDKPAVSADIDHRIPWPAGPTHPSGLRAFCRLHHLLRTFWTTWTDTQHPDGTIVFTSPAGRTYTTHPASHWLFPTWNTDTGAPPGPSTPPPPGPGHSLSMPTRRRTRAAQRRYRISRLRALNDTHIAERNRPPPF